jgi:two-component system, NarL family, response regulator LiaR
MTEEYLPKKQLETEKGGSGGNRRTAVGAGEGGVWDDYWELPAGFDEPYSSNPLRVLICDRSLLMRFAVNVLVERFSQVVGETSLGTHAIQLASTYRPDLVIVDVNIDGTCGPDLCSQISQEVPNARILVFTDSYTATKYFHQLCRAGASGVTLKASGLGALLEGIRQLRNGLPYCDPRIARLTQQRPSSSSPHHALTDMEMDVLIRLDLRDKEIAEELAIDVRIIQKHIDCICTKLSAPSRTVAALKAVRMGLVLLPVMPRRDPTTGRTDEDIAAEIEAKKVIYSWLKRTGPT